MPLQLCTIDGRPGYRWGKSSTCYGFEPGDEAGRAHAKALAEAQGAAIAAAGGEAQKDLTISDVHVATDIGTTNRQARRRKEAPAEVLVAKAFVAAASEPGADGRLAVWVRSARNLGVRAYQALKRADLAVRPETNPAGLLPLYDLVLRLAADDTESAPPTLVVRLLKAATVQQKVLGIVLEPHRVDSQDDFEEPADIEAACHQFAEDYRRGVTRVALQHREMLADHAVTVVENYIARADMQIGDEMVRNGSWLQMMHVKDPEIWGKVDRGEITGFSFGGTGARQHVPESQLGSKVKRAAAT